MMDDGDTIPARDGHAGDGDAWICATCRCRAVVYFYPKDDTPGCTREAQDFSALAGDFAAAGVTVIGVSKDSAARSTRKFAAKHDLTVRWPATRTAAACEAFGAWGEKSMYGRRPTWGSSARPSCSAPTARWRGRGAR